MKELTLTQAEQARLQILNQVLRREMAAGEAASALGVSERHIWRLLMAYRKEGAASLAHGNRGRRPPNAISEAIRAQVTTLARTRYAGLNHTHFTELLAEREGVVLARSTVRSILCGAGVASPRRRRPPRHRRRRERMPQEGMLLQLDGSHHAWLERRGPRLVLMLAVDDATGTAPYAVFRAQEDTTGYLFLLRGIVQRRGIPLAVYTDRHATFFPRKASTEASSSGAREPVQVARALQELGIRQIFAHSPEAKGRVERANGTFQDRLVAELRLAGACTAGEANEVLWEFLPRFNARFGVPPAVPTCGYRPVEPAVDLDTVFCFKHRRTVARDNTVKYRGRTLQLLPGPDRASYARALVEVQERLDGSLAVCFRGTIVATQDAPLHAAALRANRIDQAASGSSWWKDDRARTKHRERVKAGMQRAWEQGKRIGRPPVTAQPWFAERFAVALEAMEAGRLTRRRAAEELDISYATLKRILDARTEMEPLTESLDTSA